MTFRDYYQELKKMERPPHPAKAFILNLAEKTGKSPKTVQMWITGCQNPPLDVRIMLGMELGIPHDELFPDENEFS